VVSVKDSVDSYVINDAEPLSHHSFEDVDVAIIRAQFGVAENGAVWVTEEDMQIRVLPFICQHLVIIMREDQIVGTMHEAYDKIGSADYGFGVFIAGPSKTADIEQSLVLGAHGPLSAHVFILKEQN
jgi:L-lactate dehydrogenase complex protein LldG